MKRTLRYKVNDRQVEKNVTYIPVRYVIAVLITLAEILAIIGIVVALCRYVPYFYLACWATEIACVIRIIASDDNPDYKVPWLLCVLIVPIAGFMLYFLFYSRKPNKRYIRRMNDLKALAYEREDDDLFEDLRAENPAAHNQAKMLCRISGSHLFSNTRQTYFPLGEDMHGAMLEDLRRAEKFIFLEYFIIEGGVFWDSILDILKEKAAQGVEVKVVYDDIGCMATLPGNYSRTLRTYGIQAVPFSVLRGAADGEFNNRSHRKILVIDGTVGYTGGVNIADRYINIGSPYGHWKDTAIRLEGEAVWELTKLFISDYGLNVRKMPVVCLAYYPDCERDEEGYLIPFGDGPNPIYDRRVGKSVIQNMLAAADRYVYMTSPYLIIDNDLCQSIENAALRGVDVCIVVPHIPDKELVFGMTRSFYRRLMSAGVKIYEYEPGFIHAKSYLADDEYAMIGTINLDYRSLVHHFENGVWMYRCKSIRDMKVDMEDTMKKSIPVTEEMCRTTLLQSFVRSVVRIFAPLL